MARGICAAIAAAVCVLLVNELPANAASQPAYVANGGLAKAQNVSSITPSLPASPNAGDLLVLQIGVGGTVTFSISPPSVWTSLGTQSYAGYTTAVYWAVYTPGMAAPTASWTGQATATAVVSKFTGVARSPIGAVGAISFNNWGNHTSAAITTTNANSLVLLSDIAANLPNLTKPPGWTQALALNWAGGSQTLDYDAIASSGTSSGSTSSSGAATAWFTQQFEVLGSAAGASPTASLTANPASITSGQSSTLTWSSTNATSCTGTGFSTGNAISGSASVAPAATTSYSVTCSNGSASASANAIVTVTAPAPTASLTANPASITSGQSSTLTWSSTNATSCTGTGFSTGNAISGSISVAPAATTSYSVTCSNGSASASANATVTVTAPAPTASLTANPASITSGQSSILTWSSTNATRCTGTGFSTGNAISGSASVAPTTTTSYFVTCTNGSASASANATVTVTAPAPTASLTANPASITSGQSSTLTWSSTNATSCTGTGFSTGNAISGSVTVAPTTTTSYFVTCTNGSASASVSATVTVTAPAPTASLTANPASITSGQSSTLTWSSTNATSCTGTGFSTGNAISGSVTVAPTTTTTYFVTCTNGSASASVSATVTVTGTAPTASLTANPASITSGQSSTLTWSSTNATSCTGIGFSTSNAVSGSVSVTPATTATYFVTCTNGSVSASASATVTVLGSPVLTVLHSFTLSDGSHPLASLIADKSGNFYSTTIYGGASGCNNGIGKGCGVVFKLAPPATAGGAWTETVLYNFTGGADGAFPYYGAGLIFDTNGNMYGTAEQGGALQSECDGGFGCGVVFKLSPGGTETVLYTFCSQPGCSDGRQPGAGLIFDNNGNLYGTTPYGGRFDQGEVFELSPPATPGGAWTEKVLYNFTGGADGAFPFAPLILDSNGNLYGTASADGASGNGVVFKVAPNGTETVLYSFSGAADGGAPYAGLIFDGSGNLYGNTEYGGVSGAGTVFELAPPATPGGAWTETVLHSFTGADGARPYFGTHLLFDANGNLYGQTDEGGATGFGAVFKLAPPATPGGAWTETVLFSFAYGGGMPKSVDLFADNNGNIYGTTDEDGSLRYGMVYELTGTGFVPAPKSASTARLR